MIPISPLPCRLTIAGNPKGAGRAAIIRRLYAERCSLLEIRLALGVSNGEISRTLRVPSCWLRYG